MTSWWLSFSYEFTVPVTDWLKLMQQNAMSCVRTHRDSSENYFPVFFCLSRLCGSELLPTTCMSRNNCFFFSFFNKNWIVLIYLYSIWYFLNARFFLVAARVYSLQVEAFFEAAPLARSLSNNCWPLSFVTLQNGKYIRYLHITKVSTMKTETVNACKFCTIFFFPLIILLKLLVNGSISLTYNLMKKFVLF